MNNQEEVKKILNQHIDSMQSFKEKLKSDIENSPDVKEGKCTVEDEKAEPSYYLSAAIADTCIDIMQSKAVLEASSELVNKLGCSPDAIKPLFSLLTLVTVNSAYNAIVLYDDLLKGELSKQFDNYGEKLNQVIGDTNAHTGAITVLRNEITKLKKNEK